MHFIKHLCNFQFHNDAIVHKNVCNEFTDNNAIVINTNWLLLLHIQTNFTQIMHKRVLIHLFHKTHAQPIAHLESTTNDPF